MAYVINEPCIGTKDTRCVEVCPVDCIHPRADEPDFGQAEQLCASNLAGCSPGRRPSSRWLLLPPP